MQLVCQCLVQCLVAGKRDERVSKLQVLGILFYVSLVRLVQVCVIGLVGKVDLAFLIHIVGGWIGELGAQTGIEQWFGCGMVIEI